MEFCSSPGSRTDNACTARFMNQTTANTASPNPINAIPTSATLCRLQPALASLTGSPVISSAHPGRTPLPEIPRYGTTTFASPFTADPNGPTSIAAAHV